MFRWRPDNIRLTQSDLVRTPSRGGTNEPPLDGSLINETTRQKGSRSDDRPFICRSTRPRGGPNELPLVTNKPTRQRPGKSDDCHITCTSPTDRDQGEGRMGHPLKSNSTTKQQAGKSDDCRFICTSATTSVCDQRHWNKKSLFEYSCFPHPSGSCTIICRLSKDTMSELFVCPPFRVMYDCHCRRQSMALFENMF